MFDNCGYVYLTSVGSNYALFMVQYLQICHAMETSISLRQLPFHPPSALLWPISAVCAQLLPDRALPESWTLFAAALGSFISYLFAAKSLASFTQAVSYPL